MGCDFRSSFKMMARFSVLVRATFECRDYISQFLILLNAHQSVCVCVCVAFQYFRPADANRKKFSFIWSYFSMKHLFWSPLIYERVRRFFHVDFIRYVFVSVFFFALKFQTYSKCWDSPKSSFKNSKHFAGALFKLYDTINSMWAMTLFCPLIQFRSFLFVYSLFFIFSVLPFDFSSIRIIRIYKRSNSLDIRSIKRIQLVLR